MTNITIYDTEAERLNEAAAKVGESVATVIEWLVEENLDDVVKDVLKCRNIKAFVKGADE